MIGIFTEFFGLLPKGNRKPRGWCSEDKKPKKKKEDKPAKKKIEKKSQVEEGRNEILKKFFKKISWYKIKDSKFRGYFYDENLQTIYLKVKNEKGKIFFAFAKIEKNKFKNISSGGLKLQEAEKILKNKNTSKFQW